MEHLGLVRALQFLTDNSLEVATLVTDRHNQIAKYVAEKSQRLNIFMMYGTCLKVCGLITHYSIYIIVNYCQLLEWQVLKRRRHIWPKLKSVVLLGNGSKALQIICIGLLQLLLMGMTSSGDGSPLWITFATSTMIATMTLWTRIKRDEKNGLFQVHKFSSYLYMHKNFSLLIPLQGAKQVISYMMSSLVIPGC